MQSGIPHEDCGAKTQRGSPCRAPAMPNGRCRMHGGASPVWLGHPRYRHGKYSKYAPEAAEERRARRALRDARIMRAVVRKLDEWAASVSGCSEAEHLAAFRRIRGEHLKSLKARRTAYAAKKRR